MTHDVVDQIRHQARELGFAQVGISAAVIPPGYHPLLEWLARGYAADMDWIDRRRDAYRHPDGILQGTRSLIVAAMNYYVREPESGNPDAVSGAAVPARIARYAWGPEDYHDVLRRRLKQLAEVVRDAFPDCRTRAVVDTAPLLERDFARLAGIGWYGKNTMLISRSIGSWFFLGAILTDADLPADEPYQADYCGTCTRCLTACPTAAFPEPGVLDASRCISYLTIERRDKPIPEDLRSGMGQWVFGCDICQDVCPWNRFAVDSSDAAMIPQTELQQADCLQLLSLTVEAFRQQFAGTPLQRTGRDAILRNAAIALGNAADQTAVPALQRCVRDESPLIREAASWALQQIQQRSDRLV